MKIDTEALKQRHNIVDYISKYVPLKKTGANYQACCPFHNEKSPSFTVNEPKQFYHCFGCGASGNVIDFAMEYAQLDFIEACKMLGADIQLMSDKKITANQNRIISHLPSYDKRDPKLISEIIKRSYSISPASNIISDDDGTMYALISDIKTGEHVNAYAVHDNSFIAGGVSHLAVTRIKKEHSNNYVICVDFDLSIKLSKLLNINFMIAYSAMNMKLICESDHNLNLMPLITLDDTHAHNLTDKFNWVYAQDNKTTNIIKKKRGESINEYL